MQNLKQSKVKFWIGAVLSGLVTIFLLFDAVAKVIKTEPSVKGSGQLGLPIETVVGIGAVLLVCTIIYAFPTTALLGAILLTGYLGGAILAHVRAGNGAFPVIFSGGMAVLAWVGLVLREPRLFLLIALRQWPRLEPEIN